MGGMSTRHEIKERLGAVGKPLAFAAPVDPKLERQIMALAKSEDRMVDRLEAQEAAIAAMSDQVYRDVGGFEKDIGIGRLSRDSAKMIADAKALVVQANAILKDIENTGTYVKFPLDTLEKQKAYIDGVQAALAKSSVWSASMKKLQDQMRQIATQAKAKKSQSSRPGKKLRAGILDRIGAAASALTASPADPTSPQYKSQLAAARKEAQSAVANYKFMRDKAKARQDAMDKYVMSAIKVINASTNVQDVAHFTEQVQVAVRALSTMMSSVKTPFARPGAKATMDLTDTQRKLGYKWRVAYTRQLGKDQYLGGPPITMQDDLLFATESAARQWAEAMLKKGWFKGHGGGPEKILKATVLMASRPGAKAAMDKNADYVEYANLRESLSKLESRLRRAQGDERTRLQRELEAGTKRFRELGDRLRASRPGAKAKMSAPAQKPGRKVMSESDPAVSAKIRKLMAEGKPQEQAVAIALDMKRRGEI